jgi:hypothetical protein
VLVQDCDRNRFLVPDLREPIALHLFVDGSYEKQTRSFILDRLSTGDVFIDIGANIGVFTVPAAKKVGIHGRVSAIGIATRSAVPCSEYIA